MTEYLEVFIVTAGLGKIEFSVGSNSNSLES